MTESVKKLLSAVHYRAFANGVPAIVTDYLGVRGLNPLQGTCTPISEAKDPKTDILWPSQLRGGLVALKGQTECRFWDPETRKDIGAIKGPWAFVKQLGPDQLLAIDALTDKAHVYDATTYEPVPDAPLACREYRPIKHLDTSPDGQWVVLVYSGGYQGYKLTILNAKTGASHQFPNRTSSQYSSDPGSSFTSEEYSLIFKFCIISITFAKHGKEFTTCCADGLITRWRFDSMQQPKIVWVRNTIKNVQVKNFTIMDDERTAVYHAIPDHRRHDTFVVIVMDLETGQIRHTINTGIWDSNYSNSYTRAAVEFAVRGRAIVTTSSDRAIRMWDADTGKCTQVIKLDHFRKITPCIPSNDFILTSGSCEVPLTMWT